MREYELRSGYHDGEWTMIALTYVNKKFLTTWKEDAIGDMAIWS